MKTKTVIIWDEVGDQIRFFVADGDFSHLDGVYINDSDSDDELLDELKGLIYNDNYSTKLQPLDSFPQDVVREENTVVIVAGFIP
jgi:hypothetical protein